MPEENFDTHLETCEQCRDHAELCPTGERLLREAAIAVKRLIQYSLQKAKTASSN